MSCLVRHTDGMPASSSNLYDLLGVKAESTLDELRTGYRAKARALHPDVSGFDDGGRAMSELNEAWHHLGNPELRAAYDLTLPSVIESASQPAPSTSSLSRRQAWVVGVQAQVGRLASNAGKSATQTLLLRSPTQGRSAYETLVGLIVMDLMVDTEARVRAARAAGAAPLDLGVAATLIGVRTLADRVRRQGSLGITDELLMTAELLDRMWDVLAHELPNSLETALGSNPHVARVLAA